MSAMWKLVKIAGAQDKEDASVIRPVGGIEQVSCSGCGSVAKRRPQDRSLKVLILRRPQRPSTGGQC